MEDISEVDAVGLGCSLERFSEWKEAFDIIDNLSPTDGQDKVNIANYEKDYYRFRFIVDQYKEQPHLLDPYLEEIVSKIIRIATSSEISEDRIHQAFKYFRLVTNVRGFKLILQYLPHAAADMEPVLSLLEKQNPADNETWETRYSLLLWLCIIVKIPFHLSRLDDTDIDPEKTIAQRLVNICHQYLMVGDKCRDICAYLCSQFFIRDDIKESMLPGFMGWLTERISDVESGWKRLGPLYAVAAILKHGKRLDLLPYAGKILKTVISMDWKKEPYRLARLFAVKIIQRVGLTYLKARVVSWRYKRGARVLPSISEMVSGTATIVQEATIVDDDAKSDTSEVDDQEVPQELDDIVEELTQGLRDEDITVRWSAAKGIGRVMARMNKQFGDEVIGCVLDLLTPRENAFAWHGGCLALAEFSKQGLLLPARLPEIVPLVKRALVYDEPMSVGSHIIRDAACYVAWTFARAYDPDVFQPYVVDIAPSLVIVFCLDREINMRRAAAAAFQEHIGRQGTFPHGIEILTTADYYSVGVRINAYLNITTEIAKFEEYRRPIIDHLVERKTVHWDVAIRDLTAKALHNLTEFDCDYMVSTVLPTLLSNVNSIDANARHGSIIAIGEIVHALHLKKGLVLGESITRPICAIVSDFKAKFQFKGISGELMKLACCHLIDKCSQAEFPLTSASVISDWQDLLSDCLCHEVNNIRTAAAAALPSLFSQYFIKNGIRDEEKCSTIINEFITKLSASDGTLRVGHALALGSLPAFMMTGFVDVIVNGLIGCSKLTPETSKWVESRRYAIKALTSLFCTVGITDHDPKNSCRAHVAAILDCMIVGLQDYTKDDRGDTGAWVRESSMTGLQTLLLRIAKEEPSLLTEKVVQTAVGLIVQQAVERIARTRALAGTVFSSILHSNPVVPSIEHREALCRIFPEDECLHEINWLKDTDTFPRFVQLLSLSSYKRSVLFGLIAAVGGLTESLVKTASSCLFDYLRHQERSNLDEFCSIILSLYEEHIADDRVVLSMLSFLDRLLSSGAVTPVLCDPSSNFASEIFNLTRTAVGSSTDKFKLTGSVDIYCQLIQVNGSVRNKSLGRIQILLCHRFGWLRKLVATKLYEALMLYEDDIISDQAQLESALAILSDVEWSTIGIEEARTYRNKLSNILGIPTPKLVTAK